MALLKIQDAKKLSGKDRDSKIQDLRLELVKASVTANKSRAKTKEIKRAIARLLTLNKSSQEELKK